MPAILVASKMKSELPKPVHSALPIPQHPSKTGALPAAGKLKATLGSQSAHRTLQRNQSLGTATTGTPAKKTPASKGSSTDPQIYTDWANHYLAKSGHQRLIKDLQQDVADGVLLAEIIQVVANEKIQDINGYPQSRSQMIGNIEACLGFLDDKGVNIKGLCAEEIRNGNLKAILGLFFSLSRYKQQQNQTPKPTAQTQRPHSPAQPPLTNAGQTPQGSPCPVHSHQGFASPALKAHTDMTSSRSSKDSTQTKRPKLSVAQKKTSRLPGLSARAGEGKLRGASGVGSRRSQSFNHCDKARPPLSTHTPTSSHDRERVAAPSPSMADCGPVRTSSPQPSGGGGSGKPWRSKSLNAKHSSTSPMLSVKQPGSGALDAPPKVIAQKSMLEKLKLFNNKGGSKASATGGGGGGSAGWLQQGAPELDAVEADTRPGTPGSVCSSQPDEVDGGHQRPSSRSADTSPKLALRGIAQRTLSRALTPKKSALKKDAEKEKERTRAREDSLGRASTPDQHLRELKCPDSATSTPELKKSSSLPKGSKASSSAKKESLSLARSGIPKPGAKGANTGRGSVAPSCGKDGEKGHGAKPSAGLSVHKGQPDSRTSSSSSLASSEGRASQTITVSSCGPLVANTGATQASTVGVELPHPQQHHCHPNTATVAPFMYRSQTDIDKSDSLAETEGFPEPLVLCKSLHTSLEYLAGEDPEARRLRTVKNIADLRQNLEETMFSLRGTQISHSTLETTFDSSVTTEVSGRGGVLGSRPASALPWRQGSSSPRLQAGDAPSIGPRTGGNATRFSGGGNSGRYQLHHRQTSTTIAGGNPHLPDMAEEELDAFAVETAGYMSDGDILSKPVSRIDTISTSGYMTDGGLGMYTRRLNRLPEGGMAVVRENVHRSGASQADTDSWDDSSSVSSGISDTLDTDELNTSSSVSSYVNTPSAPRKAIGQQPQTDAEKHSAAELSGGAWSGDEAKCCPDGGSKMDGGSGKWCRHPSDISDESDKSSSSRKVAAATAAATTMTAMPTSISHTGSWRRGMTAQVGVTAPRTKGPTSTSGGTRSHSTGKTDDAKVSEKGCLPPRSNGHQSSDAGRDDTRKPPLSASSSSSSSSRASQMSCSPGNPTTTFGFKKQTAIFSGSATLGKMPKSMGPLQSGRTAGLCRQSSVDDAYLPIGSHGGSLGVTRGSLQYRSLPRPSRSSARSVATGSDASLRTATLPKGRSVSGKAAGATLPLTANGVAGSSNQTDREKGSEVDGVKTGLQAGSGRQAGGKYSEMSSPTLRRLFGGKPSKQASLSSAESAKNATVISNPLATSGQQNGPGGCSAATAATAAVDSTWSSTLAYPVAQGNGSGREGTEGALLREEVLAACLHTSGGMVKAGLAASPLSSPTASPKFSRNTLPRRQDRYAHLPQLRSQEESRDWLRSHSAGGLQESAAGAHPFSPGLMSPSGTTRFNFAQLAGSQPTAAHVNISTLRTTNGLANQDGPCVDPYSDPRLRNSSMSLEEKGRTMSNSGSFRDGLEEVHGSSLSLVSSTSSVYSTPEEKSHSEIRKLRRELDSSQEKVSALTTQLTANAHLVAAFEQSLGNMTIRLQSLTMTAEQKDSELNELRKTIELLKKQNTAAQEAISCVINTPDLNCKGPSNSASGSPQLQPPPHVPSQSQPQLQLQPQTQAQMQTQTQTQADLRIHRQHSSDSVSSIASATSHSSVGSTLELDAKNKKKRKNWLRSSFKQAFTKKKSPKSASSHSDIEEMTDSSQPSSPKLPHNGPTSSAPMLRTSHSNSLISECVDTDAETVMQLRSELRDKEMKLTDIRLEALSSAHQLDQLRESMNNMQGEIEKLKSENDRLKMESQGSFSRATSQSSSLSPSLPALSSQQSLSLSESTSLDMLLEDCGDGGSRKEGRRVKIVVSLEDEAKWKEDCSPRQFLIGSIGVSGKTKWDVLDGVVRRLFKECIIHVDPVSQLGLNSDSVVGYSIGEVHRTSGAETPELLPCGYLVGDSDTIAVKLKGVRESSTDSLVFETLIPKAMLQRYVSQLQEHRRIILSGPSGTGKSFLASRLAEHMVLREGRPLTDGAIATFNVDHKSSKELRQYLSHLVDQCSSGSVSVQAEDRPLVLILDNLHHLSSLGEIFNGLLSAKHHYCPYIIGTMNQANASTPNLQLHHNFRWVLCANHTEPLKGFLGRFLRRKLLETEISSRTRSAELVRVVEWLPCMWHHLNRFLEAHSSSDVTIGPRLFLSCPMDVEGARVWFTDLWNYSIIPYMLEAVREGLQLYGRRAAWEDPAKWVMESFPWAASPQQHEWPPLLQLRPEDVGFDGYSLAREGGHSKQDTQGEAESDPLMNMLMRLKEAAHSTGPQSCDSDSNSNSHQDKVIDSSLESTL
ncbi:neuron navigator 2 isoform X1 [Alosa pseudoharengus]|uniref:neuron navigator 2 isoform X1 n=1 Tax=Alosa pseudoharengus TaxID=34774 RepID=UPI003F8BEBCD